MIAGFIVPKIMLLNYGSEINGLVSSITQFINYFVIVEAGLTAAAVFLYKPLAENQHKINEVVSTTKVLLQNRIIVSTSGNNTGYNISIYCRNIDNVFF